MKEQEIEIYQICSHISEIHEFTALHSKNNYLRCP